MAAQTSKVSIVGAGAVGSTLAYAGLMRGFARTVALYDINKAKVEAEALDLAQGIQFRTGRQALRPLLPHRRTVQASSTALQEPLLVQDGREHAGEVERRPGLNLRQLAVVQVGVRRQRPVEDLQVVLTLRPVALPAEVQQARRHQGTGRQEHGRCHQDVGPAPPGTGRPGAV